MPVNPQIIRSLSGALPDNRPVPLLPGWYHAARYNPIDMLLGYEWYNAWVRGNVWCGRAATTPPDLPIADIMYSYMFYYNELPRPVSMWRSSMTNLRQVAEVTILPLDNTAPTSSRGPWRLEYHWQRGRRLGSTMSAPGSINDVPTAEDFRGRRFPRRHQEGQWLYIPPVPAEPAGLLRPLWVDRYEHHIPESWR